VLVWTLIKYRSWKEKTTMVPVTNDMMRKYGIDRRAKLCALRQFGGRGADQDQVAIA